MPIWFMNLITVLGTSMIGAGITIFFYCKFKHVPTHSKTSSIFWHKQNPTETKAILSDSPQASTGYPKIQVTTKTV